VEDFEVERDRALLDMLEFVAVCASTGW